MRIGEITPVSGVKFWVERRDRIAVNGRKGDGQLSADNNAWRRPIIVWSSFPFSKLCSHTSGSQIGESRRARNGRSCNSRALGCLMERPISTWPEMASKLPIGSWNSNVPLPCCCWTNKQLRTGKLRRVHESDSKQMLELVTMWVLIWNPNPNQR